MILWLAISFILAGTSQSQSPPSGVDAHACIGMRTYSKSPSNIETKEDGGLVREVLPGGPADKAGIRPGDLVIAVAKAAVRNGADTVERVRQTARIAQCLPVTIRRGGF